jgi:hypothetical protein
MRVRLGVALAIVLVLGSARLRAQEHGVAPAVDAPKPQAEPAKSVQVTPSVPAVKVAAAVAEALRAAEAAEARRASKVVMRPILPRRTPATTPGKRYEVRWPEQRMVVQWPGTKSDRVVLTWPDTF